MKKIVALGTCLISFSVLNAYSYTATPLPPMDSVNTISNGPILLPQDPKHFLIYTKGEITLIDAIKNKMAGTISKPNLYENLQTLFALQNGKLLALDTTGLYLSKDIGKHWDKISENIFQHDQGFNYSPVRILQNKTHPQNLFIMTDEKIFLSHDEGQSWKIIFEEKRFNVDFHPFEVLQTTREEIYIITHQGKIQWTRDEGGSWQELTNTPIPPDPGPWYIHKGFCSSGEGERGYIRIEKQFFEIKSPQEVKLVYEDKGYFTDCFVDNQQNLYIISIDNKNSTNIVLLDQNFKANPVNSFQGFIYNITQDIEGKSYLDTNLGFATAQTLKSPIAIYPAIFKQGDINALSVNNETDFITSVVTNREWFGPFETYLSQDGGNHYTHFEKKYNYMFYLKGALTYLVKCNSQLCLNTSKDNGKTWELVELPKEIKNVFGFTQERGMLIVRVSNGFYISSDLENWNAILTRDIGNKEWNAIIKKHKPLPVRTLKEKQKAEPKKVKSVKAFNAPHTECLFDNLEVNISPEKTFTLLQHGCRADDDIYLSKDEGEHWEKANSNLPESVLNAYLYVPNYFLENGDLILVDNDGSSLQKSTDGGRHFKNLISNLPKMNLEGTNFLSFAHSGNSLFAISSRYGNGLYFSRNGGETWERLDILNSSTFNLEFANQKLFLATEEDGIFSVDLSSKKL